MAWAKPYRLPAFGSQLFYLATQCTTGKIEALAVSAIAGFHDMRKCNVIAIALAPAPHIFLVREGYTTNE